MQTTDSPKPCIASALSVAFGVALVGFAYWLRTPHAAQFNEQTFGRYYTGGAIVMIGLYVLVFFGLAGSGIAAAVVAWVRRELPAWLRWAGTAMAIVAPIVAMSLIKGY